MKFILGFILVAFTIGAPMSLIRTLTRVDWAASGSGKNTRLVKKGSTRIYGIAGFGICIGAARCIAYGFDAFGIILLVVDILCIIAAIGLSQFISYKDAQDKSKRRKEQRDDALDEAQHKTAMVKTTAELKAQQAMAKNGSKVVQAKMDTAVATEKAKAAAVKSATNGMRIQSALHPSQALDYAKESGALEEGKELADKFADKYMGEMAPTVIDGQYRDVTESGHALLSQEDSELVAHIKGLAKDTAIQLLERGAERLMLDTEGKTPEEIADNVLQYAPQEYLETLPKELTDFEKAVAVVERDAQRAVG